MAMPSIGKRKDSSEEVTLTRREAEVLSAVSEGITSQEAAARLVCSKRTVDFHLANVYDKLEASNRVQALRRASELGLMTN